MKKSALIIITAVVTALLLSVSAFAGSYDDVFDQVKISEFASAGNSRRVSAPRVRN